MVAAAVIGASVVGAGASIIGSSSAADAQTAAADKASAQQAAQYQQTRSDLLPYNTAGQSALNALSYGLGTSSSPTASAGGAGTDWNAYLAAYPDVAAEAQKVVASGQFPNAQAYAQWHYQNYGQSDGIHTLPSASPPAAGAPGGAGGIGFGSLTAPVTMDQATLEKTPGYQFNLTQGEKAVTNSAAARGLGSSGAALKGAATYATGLADSTYQNQFNNAVTNSTNTYNRLMGTATLGENAGATTGALGTQTATNIGNNTIGAGNANAAGSIATGNAVGSIGNSVGNLYLTNALMKSGGGSGLFG